MKKSELASKLNLNCGEYIRYSPSPDVIFLGRVINVNIDCAEDDEDNSVATITLWRGRHERTLHIYIQTEEQINHIEWREFTEYLGSFDSLFAWYYEIRHKQEELQDEALKLYEAIVDISFHMVEALDVKVGDKVRYLEGGLQVEGIVSSLASSASFDFDIVIVIVDDNDEPRYLSVPFNNYRNYITVLEPAKHTT